MSGVDAVDGALLELGMIRSTAVSAWVREEEAWHAAGGETYIMVFSVIQGADVQRYLLKAAVPYGGRPEEAMDAWLHRRLSVEQLGISTPRLVGRHGATLLEEFIPFRLVDVLRQGGTTTAKVLQQVGETVGSLSAAGYRPISIHDWRSRGEDVVLIDFGSDLGGASNPPVGCDGLSDLVIRTLIRERIPLTRTDTDRLSVTAQSAFLAHTALPRA